MSGILFCCNIQLEVAKIELSLVFITKYHNKPSKSLL